jgi:hypothetical protein
MDLQQVFQGSSNKEVDFVQYAIYLPPREDNFISYLQDTIDLIQSFIQPLLSNYLWQKDDFHLSIVKDASNGKKRKMRYAFANPTHYIYILDPSYPFLYGTTRFGDCINDEWFIIYLLFQISLHIPESVITLSDNDGDVLLIEAALELPSWLDPSNSENRVYIHKGLVHLIPLPSSPADILQFQSTGKLLRQQAIRIINTSRSTIAETNIQDVIKDRIGGYPDEAKKEIHRSLCLLPKRAAFVLHSHPQLLPYAIEAFYLRDPFSLKACSTMNAFPPVNSIETVVRFTKTTFAQTVSQKFYAPKAFRLPSISQKKKFSQAELGMKVACGLEMLYFNSKRQYPDTDDENYSFETDKKYSEYIAHLNSLGYFKNEKKGSKLYKQLETQAKSHYLESRNKSEDGIKTVDFEDVDFEQDARMIIPPHQIIDRLLKSYSEEALNQLLEQNKDVQPDSEEWMNVDPKQLEELLMKRMGHDDMMKDLAKDFGADEYGMDLEKIMSNLENFVENKESGVDGVEFPGEEEEFSEEDDDYGEEEGNIKFNVDEFMRILTGTLGDGGSQGKSMQKV